MGRLASFKDSENRLTVERLRCTCLLRFSPCYKSGGGSTLGKLSSCKYSLFVELDSDGLPPLAYNTDINETPHSP